MGCPRGPARPRYRPRQGPALQRPAHQVLGPEPLLPRRRSPLPRSRRVAERRAALYRKFDINSVRHHKWADGQGWAGIQTENSAVRFDPEGLDLFDYQNAQFRENGIFIKLSQAFGTIRIGPDDVDVVPYADEFGELTPGARVGGGNSTLFYSPEIQELTIRQLQNILNHRNPYTGLTYAEDPAVAFVEIINESSVLFYTSPNPLRESPTLRRMTAERFSDWLRDKYTSHQGLVEAWGQRALDEHIVDDIPSHDGQPEHLDRRNILPLGNPWYWDPAQLAGSQAASSTPSSSSTCFRSKPMTASSPASAPPATRARSSAPTGTPGACTATMPISIPTASWG